MVNLRAAVRLVASLNFAAVRFHKSARDRETKAQAALSSCDRCGTIFPTLSVLPCGKARPAVAHPDNQRSILQRALTSIGASARLEVPAFADQFGQRLFHQGMVEQHEGNITRHIEGQRLSVTPIPRSVSNSATSNKFMYVAPLQPGLDHAAFQAKRDVQQIVDHSIQSARTIMDLRCELSRERRIVCREGSVHQRFARGANGCDRCFQFVRETVSSNVLRRCFNSFGDVNLSCEMFPRPARRLVSVPTVIATMK